MIFVLSFGFLYLSSCFKSKWQRNLVQRCANWTSAQRVFLFSKKERFSLDCRELHMKKRPLEKTKKPTGIEIIMQGFNLTVTRACGNVSMCVGFTCSTSTQVCQLYIYVATQVWRLHLDTSTQLVRFPNPLASGSWGTWQVHSALFNDIPLCMKIQSWGLTKNSQRFYMINFYIWTQSAFPAVHHIN